MYRFIINLKLPGRWLSQRLAHHPRLEREALLETHSTGIAQGAWPGRSAAPLRCLVNAAVETAGRGAPSLRGTFDRLLVRGRCRAADALSLGLLASCQGSSNALLFLTPLLHHRLLRHPVLLLRTYKAACPGPPLGPDPQALPRPDPCRGHLSMLSIARQKQKVCRILLKSGIKMAETTHSSRSNKAAASSLVPRFT